MCGAALCIGSIPDPIEAPDIEAPVPRPVGRRSSAAELIESAGKSGPGSLYP